MVLLYGVCNIALAAYIGLSLSRNFYSRQLDIWVCRSILSVDRAACRPRDEGQEVRCENGELNSYSSGI